MGIGKNAYMQQISVKKCVLAFGSVVSPNNAVTIAAIRKYLLIPVNAHRISQAIMPSSVPRRFVAKEAI